jgi:hypothetical protein
MEIHKSHARPRGTPLLYVVALASGLSVCHAGAAAETQATEEAHPFRSLWINPGLYSIHFQDKGFKNNNYGLGLEYRYSDTQSVSAGGFKNSDYKVSHYLSWYWEPLSLGPVKLGATIGALDGYPKYKDGGWFIAALPVASYEGKLFGLNVLLAPNYKDRLHGALSFQLKFRIW